MTISDPRKHQILKALISEARRAKTPADMPTHLLVVDFLEGLVFDTSPANRRLRGAAGFRNTNGKTITIGDVAGKLLRFIRAEETEFIPSNMELHQ